MRVRVKAKKRGGRVVRKGYSYTRNPGKRRKRR